jgi:hypothetical protein
MGDYSSIEFEMTGGSASYRVTLSRELFTRKSKPLFADIAGHIANFDSAGQTYAENPVLQLSHRIARLPGLPETLAAGHHARCQELAPGAAALGAAQLWDQLSQQDPGQKISFFTSRTVPRAAGTNASSTSEARVQNRRPSHLLYNHIAYLLSETPTFIGTSIEPGKPGIRIKGQINGVSREHCSVVLRGAKAVLNDFSTYGTFVDDTRVEGSTTLQLGQIIRVGSPGEQLQVIACVEFDET